MNVANASRAFAVLGCLLAAMPLSARVYDHLYASGFDSPADAPISDAAAARFLTQATFGPTKSSIAYLRAVGVNEWLNQQLAMTPTQERPYVEAVIATLIANGQASSQTPRYDRWYWTAVYGNDQLRQRMAFALSQIFVISDQSSSLSQEFVPMAEFWDMVARDAFGSYRALLGDVTWSPLMGRYLSHFRNQKPSSSTQPDENYAREVMQLFSVGLILRNLDFSPVLDGSLQPIPTYDQSTITHTAKVFTGFTWADAPLGSGPPSYTGSNFYGGGITSAGRYLPMACWGKELFPVSGTGSSNMRHDITGDDGTTGTAKTVLGGIGLAANQSCQADVNGELDILAGHTNVAPFISRQLIQRFVTSNPSSAYINRVALVFEDNGAPEHERGDLGAVIKAILTDSEARVTPVDVNYGKLREPLLRLTAIWRAWDAQPQPANQYGEIHMGLSGSYAFSNYGQRPLGAATVFNFYEPDYQQPGVIAGNGMYSPEFQIVNEGSTYLTSNSINRFTAAAYVGMTSPPTDRPLLDLSPLSNNAANINAMLDEANLRMLYGTMSPNLRTTLTNMLNSLSSATANEKAWSLVYLIAMSPEYASQR